MYINKLYIIFIFLIIINNYLINYNLCFLCFNIHILINLLILFDIKQNYNYNIKKDKKLILTIIETWSFNY